MAGNKVDLSVVILNYNTFDYLRKCLLSIYSSDLGDYKIEVIVTDADSKDESMKMAGDDYKKLNPKIPVKFVPLHANRGFAAGNNAALPYLSIESKNVLFLNPDTEVQKDTFRLCLDFLKKHPEAGALTCKLILVKTGQIQKECHRGFPTPWRGFWHFFGMGLPKLFPKARLFNGYFMADLDMEKTHPIEACSGAFLMVRKEAGEAIGWWNEKYFMYGEDLDFCYKLKQKGYQLFYYPETQVEHYQGISSGIIKHTSKLTKASRETKMRSAMASIKAMRIFYEENLSAKYPWAFNQFVLTGIKLMELIRTTRVKLQ